VAEVRLQEGESLENALRRFKRKVIAEDIIKEVKRHSFYLKPGEKLRVKQALARKRARKKIRKDRRAVATPRLLWPDRRFMAYTTSYAECARRASSACLDLILNQIQVGKHKPVARYDFSHFDRQVVCEHRAGVDEGVKFPVLSAGIDLSRQIREQLFIKFPADEFRCQALGVDTSEFRMHAGFDHGMG